MRLPIKIFKKIPQEVHVVSIMLRLNSFEHNSDTALFDVNILAVKRIKFM